MTDVRRKQENTAEGCRVMAENARANAAESGNPRMREILEGSASAWTARAELLDRIEASFNAREQAAASQSGEPAAPAQ